MTVFNVDNDQNLEETGYPLFLGPDLGFVDTINVTYPQFEKLYEDQVAQIWNEKEFNLDQDRKDLLAMDPGTRDVMVKTIMWQWLADSVASRSLLEIIGPHVSNPEFSNLLNVWQFFETIHGRAYSHIVRQCFDDPQALMEEAKCEMGVLQRSKVIVDALDRAKEILDNEESSITDKQVAILEVLAAFMGLESVGFMGSFSCTFAVTETKVCQGIGNEVKAICKDEVLHTRFTYEAFKLLLKDPEWAEAFALADVTKILDAIVRQEIIWADYIFSDGRKILGLNAQLLKQYIWYSAAPLYKIFKVVPEFTAPEKNPLPYMDTYVDPSMLQNAAQEIELTNYKIAAVTNDVSMDTEFTY